MDADGGDSGELTLVGIGPPFLPIAPGVLPARVATRCRLLPLPLARQAHGMAEEGARPLAIGHRFKPAQRNRRLVVAASLRGGFHAIHGTDQPVVAIRGFEKGAPLANGYRIARDVEGFDRKTRAAAPAAQPAGSVDLEFDFATRNRVPDDLRGAVRA
ncbi:MAG: hypothetical protein CAPSK01_003233 [Candidatus Accumulibacter vicinus]|uniref:Uncharacterized protein n=1 Tax=Candidatus Accumulibacter vicinus TaxID=2954382 RepID=A0A084XY21_9PROT|nr:MAG: hypothetical protein CAPSK01_003233 [Candidatus Accumulibacter vicinus]